MQFTIQVRYSTLVYLVKAQGYYAKFSSYLSLEVTIDTVKTFVH